MLQTLVRDYEWIHVGVGLLGNIQFFVGSIFFLKQLSEFYTLGVWLFICGSLLMMLGAAGSGIKSWYVSAERRQAKATNRRTALTPSDSPR